MVWRWIGMSIPESSPGMNMAIDSVMVETAAKCDYAGTIRVYRWSAPAVTMGRLQKVQDVRSRFPNVSLIRRPTGGHAVEHGDDLTVSIVVRSRESGESSK